MTEQAAHYSPGTHPDMPAPAAIVGVRGWLMQNLMSSPLNIALTLGSMYLIYIAIPPILDWVLFDADWTGETRASTRSRSTADRK